MDASKHGITTWEGGEAIEVVADLTGGEAAEREGRSGLESSELVREVLEGTVRVGEAAEPRVRTGEDAEPGTRLAPGGLRFRESNGCVSGGEPRRCAVSRHTQQVQS